MNPNGAKHAKTYLHGLSLGPWLPADVRASGLLDLPERAAGVAPEDFTAALALATVRELLPLALRATSVCHPERESLLESAAQACEVASDLISAHKAAIAAVNAAYEAQPAAYVRRAVPDASSTRVPDMAHDAAIWSAHASQERRIGRVSAAAYAAVATGHCVLVALGSDASAQVLDTVAQVSAAALGEAVLEEAPARPVRGMSM